MEEQKKLTGYPSIDKPWLKYYSEEANNAPLPECTIYEYLWENNKDHLDDIAIDYFGHKITYHTLFDNIHQLAKGLYSIGVREGDIVTIISINTPEMIYSLYALNLLGAIPNMEYVTETEKEAVAAIERCKSKTVIILDVLFDRFKSIIESTTVKHIIVLEISSSMPIIKRTMYNLKYKKRKTNPRKCISYPMLLQCCKTIQRSTYKKDSPAVIVHSGGTTGVPKGVVLTNDNLNYIAWIFKHHQNDTKRADTWLCAIPAFHAFGLAMGIIFPLSQGMQLILVVKYTDQEIVRLFVKDKPNHIMGSGAHIPSIQNSPAIQKMDLSFFKTCGLGGTPLSVEKEKELVSFLQHRNSIAKASIGYGMSETSSAIATELNRYYGKPGSAGIILCKSSVKVLDTDGNEELTYGKIGELCFSGPGIMKEYYNNREETEKALFLDKNGTKWVHSGDLGYVDKDGFIFITGRIKRIYSTRAEKNGALYKIYPDYVAKVIKEDSNINECAVVCIDDPNYKSIAIAYAAVFDNTDVDSTKARVINHLKQSLTSHSIPKELFFIDAIPMTPIGKIDYRALEERAAKEHKGE